MRTGDIRFQNRLAQVEQHSLHDFSEFFFQFGLKFQITKFNPGCASASKHPNNFPNNLTPDQRSRILPESRHGSKLMDMNFK